MKIEESVKIIFPSAKGFLIQNLITRFCYIEQVSSKLHSKVSTMKLEIATLTCYRLIIKYTNDKPNYASYTQF